MKLKYLTLLVPIVIVLNSIWGLGTNHSGFVVDGQLVVVTIILCGVLFLAGYLFGKEE